MNIHRIIYIAYDGISASTNSTAQNLLRTEAWNRSWLFWNMWIGHMPTCPPWEWLVSSTQIFWHFLCAILINSEHRKCQNHLNMFSSHSQQLSNNSIHFPCQKGKKGQRIRSLLQEIKSPNNYVSLQESHWTLRNENHLHHRNSN